MRWVLFASFVMSGPLVGDEAKQARLTSAIDRHWQAEWQRNAMEPAPVCDDATFLRRVSLDLIGRIPTVAETRAFLNHPVKNKRAMRIAALLQSHEYAQHWATFWRREWIPQGDTVQPLLTEAFEEWLAQQLHTGGKYDVIVRTILLATSNQGKLESAPNTFLNASEFKPENLAANTARAFMGLNLDCAQCHDHPFARWSREQFWETAAFFVRADPSTSKEPLQINIPGTKKTVIARFLLDPQPRWPIAMNADTGRVVLADWLVRKENPYFAANAVNRVWAQLFGIGFVEPLDDLSGQHTPLGAKLFEHMQHEFVASGYDLRFLLGAILQSETYQRASTGSASTAIFARANVRALTGEQLYDSLRTAAGLPRERSTVSDRSPRQRAIFSEQLRVNRVGDSQRSILQALAMMNGRLTQSLTSHQESPILRSVIDAPFMNTSEKLETLFLATLGRKPSANESTTFERYVTSNVVDRDQRQAWADILWALLNSSEFSTNH